MQNPHSCNHDCKDHQLVNDNEDSATPSLLPYIDVPKLRCLNEKQNDSCQKIFRGKDKKLERNEFVESDVDEELLLIVKFTGEVRLKSFVVIGGSDGTAPSNVKLYINKPDLDFDGCRSSQATQEFDLHEDARGVIEYQTKYARFQNVRSLSMFFPANFGGDVMRIHYIQLNGVDLGVKHDIVQATYELKPNAAKNSNNITSNTVLQGL